MLDEKLQETLANKIIYAIKNEDEKVSYIYDVECDCYTVFLPEEVCITFVRASMHSDSIWYDVGRCFSDYWAEIFVKVIQDKLDTSELKDLEQRLINSVFQLGE